MKQRPKNIKEVSALLTDKVGMPLVIGDFLDEFKLHPNKAALETEPFLNSSDFNKAWLAALGEYLAIENKWTVPSWCSKYQLDVEYIPKEVTHKKLIDLLREETPAPFKKRNILMSENGLKRA